MKVITGLFMLFCKTINPLVPKSQKSVYFIPHDNCAKDKYDIINYRSDNALSLFNYMIRDKILANYAFYIEINEIEKIKEYYNYCKNINPQIKVNFLLKRERHLLKRIYGIFYLFYLLKDYFCLLRSSYIFTCSFYYDFSFKTSVQKVICLGYYTPFKDNYHKLTNNQAPKKCRHMNASFDFHIATSELPSRILSVDSGIFYYKFLALGYPRNDTLIETDNIIPRKNLLVNIIGQSFKKMILYTPTFRDYETGKIKSRNIFGSTEDSKKLSDILVKNDCILIAKLHPWQNSDIIEQESLKNIFIFPITPKLSLYELMSISDVLITDYTSAYFDYLLLNRPVIFYFYDFELYKKERGFSFNPIECFCAGDIVYSFDALLDSISKFFNNIDDFKKERERINLVFNKYSDNNSSRRICDRVFNLSNCEDESDPVKQTRINH